MRLRFAVAPAAVLVLASTGTAAADIEAGVRVDGIPDGSIREGADGARSVDLPPGYAVGGELRYATRAYAVGLAPRYVRFGDHEAPDHELDLAVRIAARRPISSIDAFELSFTLGYAFVPDAEGFIVGTGAALVRRVGSRLSVLVEGGYQYGFQARTNVEGEVVAPRFVHAGLGVRAHL